MIIGPSLFNLILKFFIFLTCQKLAFFDRPNIIYLFDLLKMIKNVSNVRFWCQMAEVSYRP